MHRAEKKLTRAEKIRILKDISAGKVKAESLLPKPVLTRMTYSGYYAGKPNTYFHKDKKITEEEFIEMGGGTDRSLTLNINVVTTGRKPIYSEKDIED